MISKLWLTAGLVAVLGTGFAAPALAAEDRYTFTTESTLSYLVTHPMHESRGTSNKLQGEIKVIPGKEPDLAMPLTLTIPVRSFNSKNRSRDNNMAETMNAARYPTVTLVLDSVNWTSRKTEGSKTLAEGVAKGNLTMHGVTHPVQIKLTGSLDPEKLEVDSQFQVMLTDYNIVRPSLFFKPVDDAMTMTVKGIAKRS